MDDRQHRRGAVGVAVDEWSWPTGVPEILERIKANLTIAESAYISKDYGQFRAYMRDIEALCWAARSEAQKAQSGHE